MVSLEEIKNSLSSNQNLTEDVKKNLIELITIFSSKFPNVNLTNLNERIKTLKIIRGSKFLIRGTSYYNPVDNELLISLVNFSGEIDGKHILMRELLNIITAKDNYTGFNKNNNFEALNIGYTEMLTNFLVGNEYESEYEDEIIASNVLATVIGNDTMLNAYFNNDDTLIMNDFC